MLFKRKMAIRTHQLHILPEGVRGQRLPIWPKIQGYYLGSPYDGAASSSVLGRSVEPGSPDICMTTVH